MKNIGLAKVLDGLGLEWSEEGDGMYEISAMAYLPEEYEDKRSFMEEVLDTANRCGYPELRAELCNGGCILSKVVKQEGRHICKTGLKKELFLFSEAYNFFVMNVMLRVDMNNNPEEYGL